jgi:hypothetical protein
VGAWKSFPDASLSSQLLAHGLLCARPSDERRPTGNDTINNNSNSNRYFFLRKNTIDMYIDMYIYIKTSPQIKPFSLFFSLDQLYQYMITTFSMNNTQSYHIILTVERGKIVLSPPESVYVCVCVKVISFSYADPTILSFSLSLFLFLSLSFSF